MNHRDAIAKKLEKGTLYRKEELKKIVEHEWGRLSVVQSRGREALSEMKKDLLRGRKRTKQRWVAKEELPGSPFNKGMREPMSVLAGKDGPQAFWERYKVKDMHTYRAQKWEELNSWANDDDSLLVYFRFLESKPVRQKNAALHSDAALLCLIEMLGLEEVEPSKTVVSRLNSLLEVAEDPTSRMSFPAPEEGETVRALSITLPRGRGMRQELNVEEAKTDAYSNELVLKALNGWDMAVLQFALYKLREQQYKDKEIFTTRNEILEFMDATPSGRNYKIVEASIRKLISLTIFIQTPKSNFSLRFFDNYSIIKGEKEVLNIRVNVDVHTQALNGKITSMYKDVIDSLSSPSAAIIYRLQRLRIQRHYQGESAIVHVDLDFFSSILLFGSRRRHRILRTIEDSLDEIISVGVTLKRYARITDSIYELEFFPLSSKEVEDLGTINTNMDDSIFPPKQKSLT